MRTPHDASEFIQREIRLLAVLLVAAISAFVGTRAAAEWDRRTTLRAAHAWYDVGTAHLQAGRVEAAVKAFGRASTRDRTNRAYGTALARALNAAGRQDDARQVLLQLRESSPEDPSINVELARLEIAHQDVTAAVRYYHSALYGIWGSQPPTARQQVQLELIRFLLAQGQRDNAQAELLALVPNLDAAAPAHIEAGQLFITAGDPRHALDQFRRALDAAPDSRDARAGAADAAFLAADYAAARRYLRDLPDPPARLVEQDALAALVLENDPLQARVPLRERRARVARALGHVIRHIETCGAAAAGQPDAPLLQAARTQLQDLDNALAGWPLRDVAEHIDASVDLLRDVIPDVMRRCPASTRMDQALLLIVQPHEDARP